MLTSCGTQSADNTAEDTKEQERIGDRGYNEKSFETNDKVESKPILPEEECDFGNFQWGMSLEDVVNVHGGGYSVLDENTIRYERVRIEGFASDAEYTFTDGKLSGATYFIMPDSEYDDKTQYITDFNALSENIYKTFRQSHNRRNSIFADGKDTDDITEQGKLLGEGNILFRKVWETDTTEIRAVMAKKTDCA